MEKSKVPLQMKNELLKMNLGQKLVQGIFIPILIPSTLFSIFLLQILRKFVQLFSFSFPQQ